MKIIKSTNTDQQEIINDILTLHNGGMPIELDCTYSIGVFYRNGVVSQPKFKTDLSPSVDGVLSANSCSLPFQDSSLQSIMFDPPFIIHGNKKEGKYGSCVMFKRFSGYRNYEELKEHYSGTLRESYRILKQGGILIFKLQNTVSGGKQHFSHWFVISEAMKIGFYPKDEFVLQSKSKITSFGGRWKTQQHAMKYHSFFLVFAKTNKSVNYTV